MPKDRILIVEDDDGLRQATWAQLKREGYETASAASAEEALPILEQSLHHLMLVDLQLPGMSGLDLLKRAHVTYPETAVIVTTAYGTVKTAVEAMKAGAYDYITKPIHPYDLKMIVKRSLDHYRLQHEVELLRSTYDSKCGFEEIIGSSAALLSALDVASRMASTNATVLISGETGTGKEVVAKAIHLHSQRRERPFATINCGAIPRELLESELFGHVKGAFTGALMHKRGKVEIADGGTVLLDEIGEMPLDLQVRILRLIQEHEIEKIGATASSKVDVRIIAATHRNLAAMVRQGSFREDLYYRLLVVPINLPPLRERTGDIEELVAHFFTRCRAKHHRFDMTMKPEVMRYFLDYRWPGNVRELENVIERMVLLSKGTELTVADLPEFLHPGAVQEECPFRPAESGMSLEAMEKQTILQALKHCRGNQTLTARQLGMSRRKLAYRLEKYGVHGDVLGALKHAGR